MKKGRPIGSIVRNNIAEILFFLGKEYGYNIYKIYVEIFPKVSRRLIYYHLKKGVELKEFKIEKTEKVKGEYSWGSEAEKTYYSLDRAKPKGDLKVKAYLDKLLEKSK